MKSIAGLGRASITASLLFGLVACGNGGFEPPSAGTQFAWKYVSEDGVDDDLVTVIATGPDFAIFRQALDDSHFVEFSAIGFASCEEDDLPSREDREAVLSAWPLTVGTEIKWKTDKILIERKATSSLGEREEPVFWFTHEYADDSSPDDRFAISPRYGTSLELQWPENARDFVVSVNDLPVTVTEARQGYTIIEGTDVLKLGNCQQLLTETEPVTPKPKN